MFEQFVNRPFHLARYRNGAYAEERSRFLSHLVREGRSPSRLPVINFLLLASARAVASTAPVILIAIAQTQAGLAFKSAVKFGRCGLDDVSQIAERARQIMGLTTLLQEGRQIFLGIGKGNIGCEEADTWTA
jgi:hypothetical protein